MEPIQGGVSSVLIEGNVVKKKYTLEYDGIYDSHFGYLTTELVVLNLLGGTEGFPKIRDILLESPNYVIVMPYLCRPIDSGDYSRELFIEILLKIAFLHDHDIVHCDIKPKNILIDDIQHKVSIIDFSHSFIMGNFAKLITDKYGTPRIPQGFPHTLQVTEIWTTKEYSSPEGLNLLQVKTTKVDVWGLGCLLYELLTGKTLFEPESIINFQNEEYIDQKIMEIVGHEEEKKWLHQMLQVVPEQRPSVRDLLVQASVDMSSIRKIYDVNKVVDEIEDYKRLSCFNFNLSLQMFVYCLYDEIHARNPELDRYDLMCMVHAIIGVCFIDKSDQFAPYDTLSEGRQYMNMLALIIKKFKLSIIYD